MLQAIKGSSPAVLITGMLTVAGKALGKPGAFIVIINFAALLYLPLQEGWV